MLVEPNWGNGIFRVVRTFPYSLFVTNSEPMTSYSKGFWNVSVVFSRHWTQIVDTIGAWSAILATDFSLEVMFRRVEFPPYSLFVTNSDHIRWGSKGFWNASVVFSRHWTQIVDTRMTLLKAKISILRSLTNSQIHCFLVFWLLPKRSKMTKETQRVPFWSIWNVARIIFHCSRPIRCQARHPLVGRFIGTIVNITGLGWLLDNYWENAIVTQNVAFQTLGSINTHWRMADKKCRFTEPG